MWAVRDLPKIELHCHLDGCVRVETAADICAELNLPAPSTIRDAMIAPPKCGGLADLFRYFELPLLVTQRRQDLERVACELIEDMAADGVIYAEVRFAPSLHTRRGLAPEEAIEAFHTGLQRGGRIHGVGTGLIVCCLRRDGEGESIRVARLAASQSGQAVGFDVAGDEQNHADLRAHGKAFQHARQAGLGITVHAGEFSDGPDVEQAIELLGAQRLGHGLCVVDHPRLIEQVTACGITLEMCPRSNRCTGASDRYPAHPIASLKRVGVAVTVNTDSRIVTPTTLTDELLDLKRDFGWGLPDMLDVQRNAARSVFADDAVKSQLLKQLDSFESGLIS